MSKINAVLIFVGDSAGLTAIACFLWVIANQFRLLWNRCFCEIEAFDRYGYLGLTMLGLWMACEIGRIGL